MGFIDILALEEGLILAAAVLVGYTAFTSLLAMRRNDVAGLKAQLKSAAVPIGAVGIVATIFGVWGEIVWPYPAPYLTSYNILFNDTFLLFGLTMVAVAGALALGLRLQYAGLFGLIAGGITISYGWNGYVLGMTKDPLETFLLFGAFGLTGILSLPVTIMADQFLAHPDGTAFASPHASSVGRPFSMQASARAAQPVVPGTVDAKAEEDPAFAVPILSRLPAWVTVSMLVFVVSAALAAVAALWYLDLTMPAHLASPP